MEETTWRKPNVKEGFDLFGDDYFINVKRTIRFPQWLSKIKDILKKWLKKIPNPIDMADKGLESFLKTLLMLMIGQIDCKTGKLSTALADIEEGGFTWASGKMDMLKNSAIHISDRARGVGDTIGNGVIGVGDTIGNGARGVGDTIGNGVIGGWNKSSDGARGVGDTINDGTQDTLNKTNDVEYFSMPDTPDLIHTIQSFLKNHPKLDKTAVTTYYLKKLNAYELSINSPPTSDRLFIFNNEFDNILEDPKVIGEIQQISQNIPKSSYPNTAKGFADFLENSARFSFSNDTPITYYQFATQYFPYPTDLEGFEKAIHNPEDPDYVANINQYLSSLTKPADPPPNPVTPTSIDPNYAFSSNINTSKTDSIQTYLKYVTEWYSLLVYYKYNADITTLFPTIEANVCSVYITYLNAIEFQKYRVYSTYLTPYELAVFNHLFFICIQQDQKIFMKNTYDNVYNLEVPPDGNTSYLSGTPIVYINLMPQSIFSLVTIFAMEMNNRVKYLSGSITTENYQPLPLDSVLILPEVPNEAIPSMELLLANYVLGLYTPTTYGNTTIPDELKPSSDIQSFYLPEGMSECEHENSRMQQECEGYAKKIKGEIYRMISVPIMVYIVYNFYYMFFFKDCYDLVKKTDEAGTVQYEPKAMECFTPIFPDWELMYRSFEQRQTDFFFEFVFKPVKMVYTLLNAIKAFFRKDIGGYVFKDHVPYLFFLWTVIPIYRFMTKHANIILNTLGQLVKFKLPDVPIMGKNALDGYAKGITVFFFFFSFLNKFFGISISEIMECIYNAYLAKKAAQEAARLAQQAQEGRSEKKGWLSSMASKARKELSKTKNYILGRSNAPDEINTVNGGEAKPGAAPGAAPAKSGAAPDSSMMGNCKLQGPSYENSWVKWIMKTGDGAFTKLIKIVCAIIYWILKFVVSMRMVKFAKTIFTVYFFMNAVLGLGNYTTPLQSSSYKIDLIHRIFYTKLCSSSFRTEPFKYFAKCIIFLPIYFLVEMIILHNLMKGMKTYASMSSNKTDYNTGLSAKTNDDADKNSMAVKTFMMVLNGLIVIFVLLWCVYKAVYKMPKFVSAYEEQDNPSTDKRLVYDCSKQVDVYEERSRNNVLKTIIKSDEYNKAFIEQFDTRTAGMKKPSSLAGLVTKMGEYGKQMSDKLTELGEKTNKTVFGKPNNISSNPG